MLEDDPRVIAIRKRQEEVVLAIQQEENPTRLSKLIAELLELNDRHYNMLHEGQTRRTG